MDFGAFVVVYGSLWWFVVVCGGLWWFVVVCGGLWWILVLLWWFVVVCDCLLWFVVVYVDLINFVAVCSGFGCFMVAYGVSTTKTLQQKISHKYPKNTPQPQPQP